MGEICLNFNISETCFLDLFFLTSFETDYHGIQIWVDVVTVKSSRGSSRSALIFIMSDLVLKSDRTSQG